MKALIYQGEKRLTLEDIPAPEGPFVVRVLGCAICGTDLKTYLHGHPYFKPPTILGHEFYGVVERAPESTGYRPGDAVSVAPYGECGECEKCLSGNGDLCSNKGYVDTGAFCELVNVPLSFVERGVFPIASPDKAYALVEPLSCVLNAVEQMEMKQGDKALVIGGGPMGALIALTLLDMGIEVHIAELNEKRRDCLNGWGIGAAPLEGYALKDFNRIFVAVNKKELAEKAINEIGSCGKVHIFAGMPSGTKIEADAGALHYRKVSVLGCSGFSLKQFRRAFKIISANPDHYRRLITHEFPLGEGEKAFELLQSGDAFKILLKP